MTVEIKRTKKDHIVEVYRYGNYLGDLIYDKIAKTFGIVVGGSQNECADSYWDFETKEKAVGKMLNYYGIASK